MARALLFDLDGTLAANARDIARDLDWPPEEIRLAEALGWLHDVGRFDQFDRHGHFQDASSFNHGHHGADLAEHSGLLDDLDDESCACLLNGIRHHNAKCIPAGLPPDHLRFLQLLRDADKLDIFRVVTEGLERDGFRELAGLWPGVDLDGPLHPALLQDIASGRNGDIAHVRSLADFLLLQASWIYSLHFAPTRQRVRQRRVLDTLASRLPDLPDVRAIFDNLRRFLDSAPC